MHKSKPTSTAKLPPLVKGQILVDFVATGEKSNTLQLFRDARAAIASGIIQGQCRRADVLDLKSGSLLGCAYFLTGDTQPLSLEKLTAALAAKISKFKGTVKLVPKKKKAKTTGKSKNGKKKKKKNGNGKVAQGAKVTKGPGTKKKKKNKKNGKKTAVKTAGQVGSASTSKTKKKKKGKKAAKSNAAKTNAKPSNAANGKTTGKPNGKKKKKKSKPQQQTHSLAVGGTKHRPVQAPTTGRQPLERRQIGMEVGGGMSLLDQMEQVGAAPTADREWERYLESVADSKNVGSAVGSDDDGLGNLFGANS